MTREEKNKTIDALAKQLSENDNFYLTDVSELEVEESNNLRRLCFEQGVSLTMVKNTLLKKAFEQSERDFEELYDQLKGSTSIMFTEAGNAPAKIIKQFRKNHEKPLIKVAYVEESVYIGDDKLELLAKLKSKNELIADVMALLQSPAKNVISQLNSGGQKLTGILKTLSEKDEN